MPEEAAMNEQEFNIFNELDKIFGQFFTLLFAIIAALNTDGGNGLLMKHHGVIMALIILIVIYFIILVLDTLLQLHTKSCLAMLAMLLLGTAITVLALIIISGTVAWIALASWIVVIACNVYYNGQEINQMIPERIKTLIAGDAGEPIRPPTTALSETQNDNLQTQELPPESAA